MLSIYSIGVHFSQTHTFIVCLEKTLSKIRVREYTRIDLSSSSTLIQRLEDLAAYLTTFIESKRIGAPRIYLSFPTDLSIVRQLTFPSAVKEDLPSTIQYSLEKYIPLKVEDICFDFSIISEDKEKKCIRVLLGAAKKKDLTPFFDLAVSIETGVSGVQNHTTAIANFICNDSELALKSYPELFVFYADKNKLDIILFRNGTYEYSRHVEAKGNEENFLELVRNELKNKKDVLFTNSIETAIVFCGNGITDSILRHFDADPRVSLKQHGFQNYALPSEDYIPAVGLALNGLVTKKEFQLNFLPESKRKKASKTANYFMYALIFLSILFGTIWSGSYFLHQKMAQKRIDAKLLTLESQLKEISHKKVEIRKIEKKIAAVNRLRMEQVEINMILKELSKIIPSGSWLNSFSFKIDKGIRIGGESDAASDLIPLLEASERFKNCVFLSAITKDRSGKERFLIGCDIIREGFNEK